MRFQVRCALVSRALHAVANPLVGRRSATAWVEFAALRSMAMASHVESSASSTSRRVRPPDGNELTVGSSIRPLLETDATHISSRPPVSTGDGLSDPPGLIVANSLVGTQLDHFVLEEFVGGGGMGAVFRARDSVLDRAVAIKVLARDRVADPETYQRFQNEGKSAARLDHPNVARVFYSGEAQGLAYIVFEFIEGVNLRDLVLERKRLPVVEAIGYTLQVAEALAHASSHDVVHRDVKPSNVIINSDGHVKLVDMGLARVQHPDQSHDDLTASGVTLGTFDYISPEQARDPRYADVRSDIYSLGCTLYYMLTGQAPYPEGTVLQKLLQHQGDEAPDPRQFNPDTPAEVAAIVSKMMAKQPERRYQNAPELVADLLLVGERLGLRSGGASGVIWVTAPHEAPHWLERHSPWMAAVGLLVLIVLGLDYYWSGQRAELVVIERPQIAAAPSEQQPSAIAKETTPIAPDAKASATPTTAPIDGTTSPQPPSVANDASRRDEIKTANATEPNGVAAESAAARSSTNDANTARTAATERQGPTETAVVPAPRAGVLIVDPTGATPNSHRSLFAACSMAKSGEVIELMFNGRRDERPILVHSLNLTIRAARGYSPVVVFRPSTSVPDGTRAMISIAGGRLTLVDVACELELAAGTSGGVSTLFELEAAEGLTLRNCSLTARDLAWDRGSLVRAAMITLTAPAVMSTMPQSDTGDLIDVTSIELEHCIARGEATFLSSPQPWPFALSWDNGLLALSGRLLESRGALTGLDAGAECELDLRHLTAIAPRGLCRFIADGPALSFLPTEVRLVDSLVQISGDGALVEHIGLNPLAQSPQSLIWRGQRNVYDLQNFWRTGADDDMPFSGTDREFGDWLAIWKEREAQARQTAIAWQRTTPATRPMHLRTTSDYLLDSANTNNRVAVAAANDARDLGMDVTLLPTLPPEPTGTTLPAETVIKPPMSNGMGDMMP